MSRSLRRTIHPQFWTWRTYAWTAAILLALNLFGPKGFIPWVLMGQELSRLTLEKTRLEQEHDEIRYELARFRKSSVAKARAIRDELGYLKPDEISIEIQDARPRR